MNSTHKRPWLRGKALTTLLALRGLKEGDEVKIKACDRQCRFNPMICRRVIHHGRDTRVFIARQMVLYVDEAPYLPTYASSTPPNTGHYLVRDRETKMGTFIELHNVAAWRQGRRLK